MRVNYLEHVFHVLGCDEGVVDSHNLHVREARGRAEEQTANSAESVDTNGDFTAHFFSLEGYI